MKLKISINLLLFTSAIAHASPIIINSINLKVGETQRIELRSNPTTGYSWYPTKKIEKNPIITLVKSGYEADNTLPAIAQKERRLGGLVGSGGIQFWEIRGKKAGSYTLTLQYKRPWEKKVKPVEVKKFVIEVQQKTT